MKVRVKFALWDSLGGEILPKDIQTKVDKILLETVFELDYLPIVGMSINMVSFFPDFTEAEKEIVSEVLTADETQIGALYINKDYLLIYIELWSDSKPIAYSRE